MLAPIWRRRGKTACHGSQAPFFHVCFDEDEATLSKIHVNGTRTVRAYRGEEILGFEAMSDIIKLFAVSSEEKTTCSWTVADAYHVALNKFGTVVCRVEGLIMTAMSSRSVSD